MTSGILYHERLNFVRRGPALLAVTIVVLATLYAGWSGAAWRDARASALQAFEAERNEALSTYRDELVQIANGDIEPGVFAANPMSISFPAVLPPAPLADFSIGHADLQPSSGDISPWRNLSSIFGRYQFDNPSTLAAGEFDIALVIVLLMPVLMIAVSFDVLAGERTRGALSMVLASPVRLGRLVWARLLFRNGLLWAAAILTMGALLLIHDSGGDRLARFGLWLIASLAYALFWLAVIAYCVARFRSAIDTAAAMIGTWLLIVLALPAAISTLAEATYPTPSRLAFLSEIRETQVETNRNLASLTEGYLFDHPELSVGNEGLPSFYRAAFLANQAARDSTRQILEDYESAREGRARTVALAQYLSPAVLTRRQLLAAAGGDLDRQYRFEAQTRAALDQLANDLGPAIVSRNRLTPAQFDALEPFTFVDRQARDIAGSAALPLLFLLLVSGAIGLQAQRRLDATVLDS